MVVRVVYIDRPKAMMVSVTPSIHYLPLITLQEVHRPVLCDKQHTAYHLFAPPPLSLALPLLTTNLALSARIKGKQSQSYQKQCLCI